MCIRDSLYYLYNNTPGTASPFSFDIEEEASLGYEFWGNTNFDTVDYFTTTLPAANYDSVYLRIKAQNNQCGGTQWIQYFCYKNGSSTPSVSYTHLRAHETVLDLVCRLLLEKKKTHIS